MSRKHTELPPMEIGAGRPDTPEGSFTEAMRAGPELAQIAAQLLSVLFPDKAFVTELDGAWVRFAARPALSVSESRRLLDHLHDLADRPEWRARHAVAREVTDAAGRRVEVLVPLPPAAYAGGEALVGPFPHEEAAREWAATVQQRGLAADTLEVAGAWLCDLFALGELLDG